MGKELIARVVTVSSMWGDDIRAYWTYSVQHVTRPAVREASKVEHYSSVELNPKLPGAERYPPTPQSGSGWIFPPPPPVLKVLP